MIDDHSRFICVFLLPQIQAARISVSRTRTRTRSGGDNVHIDFRSGDVSRIRYSRFGKRAAIPYTSPLLISVCITLDYRIPQVLRGSQHMLRGVARLTRCQTLLTAQTVSGEREALWLVTEYLLLITKARQHTHTIRRRRCCTRIRQKNQLTEMQ